VRNTKAYLWVSAKFWLHGGTTPQRIHFHGKGRRYYEKMPEADKEGNHQMTDKNLGQNSWVNEKKAIQN